MEKKLESRNDMTLMSVNEEELFKSLDEKNLAEENQSAPLILEELHNKRSLNGKHFRTDNGSFVSVIYKEPIHFEKEGQWLEIDNTLVQKEDESLGKFYQNKAGETTVKFPETTSETELISLEKGDYHLTWKLAREVFTYEKLRRKKRSIENEKPRKVNFTVKQTPKGRSAQKKTPVDRTLLRKKDIENINLERTKLAKAFSKGVFKDVLENIDIEYILKSNIIKENIILKDKSVAGTPIAFELTHKNMELHLKETGEVVLNPINNLDEIIFSFPVPFMVDKEGMISDDVHYEVEIKGNHKSIVRIVPDYAWLIDPSRTYPVKIDPVTETHKTQNDIDDTYISSLQPNKGWLSAYGSFLLGRNYHEGICRGFIKFKQLPVLDPGDIIYLGKLQIWQYEFSAIGTQSFKVTAHDPGPWSPETTWNTQPTYDSKVLDYQTLGSVSTESGGVINVTYTPKVLDITKLVRNWYNTGVNNGIMLKSTEENRDAVARFFTSNFDFDYAGMPGGEAQYPAGFFYYKNASGLEDYWSYHKQSVGRAGKGYVNDFNGNLVFIHQDAKTPGTRMPAEISHVYNYTDSNKPSRFGYGWRINGMQRLESTGITLSPYAYTDSDGTKHYFYSDNGIYKDEDGLSMEYKAITEGELVHQITFKDKTLLKFDLWGYLRKIINVNGNQITYNYGPHGNGNYLGNVDDGAGQRLSLFYTNNYERLDYILDTANRKTSYGYDASGNLTSITYSDGTKTLFEYSGHQLTKVTNSDGNSMEYAYKNDMRIPRISQVTEKAGTNVGQILKYTYKNGNTTVVKAEKNLSTATDDITMTYNFDNMGRPTDVRDQYWNANSYKYFSDGLNNNRLNVTGKTQKAILNFVSNPNIEDVPDPWHFHAVTEGINYSVNRVADVGFMDKRSIKVTKVTSASMAGIAQNIVLQKFSNLIYTFSAYVKTENIIPGEGVDQGAILMVYEEKTDGTRVQIGQSKTILGTTDVNFNEGWQRLDVSFPINSLNPYTTIKILGGINNASGTAWFDCFQVENSNVPNKFNLINDPGFEISNGTEKGLKYWGSSLTKSYDGRGAFSTASSFNGKHYLGIYGEFGTRKSYSQGINVSGEKGDVFNLSCMAQANAIPGKEFRIAAAVIYDQGEAKWTNLDFNPYTSEWQYVSGIISTDDGNPQVKRKYTAIHIYIFFDDNANWAFFDNVQLVKDVANSYVYNNKGELVSSKSAADASNYASDKNENVTRLTKPTGSAFEYAYDSKNNMRIARNVQGVSNYLEYDDYGNPLVSIMESSRVSGAVYPGKVYFIRQKTSGKYLDVDSSSDVNNANVCQKTFVLGQGQKWRVLDAGNGYYSFTPLLSGSGRVLDVTGGVDADGTNVVIHDSNGTDAQKFKLKVVSDGSYQITVKCAQDERVLTNQGSHTSSGTNIDIRGIVGEHNDQSWYFEELVNGRPATDNPMANNTYYIRLRHSGQYFDVFDKSIANNGTVGQSFLNMGLNQRFKLEAVLNETGYYYIIPQHAPTKVLQLRNDNGVQKLEIFDKTNGDHQKFTFVDNRNMTFSIKGKSGMIIGTNGETYNQGAALIASSGNGSIQQQVLLEMISDVMKSEMTYTDNGALVKTVKDGNGRLTTYHYDNSNRGLITSVSDSNGRVLNYQYNANTDQLEKVSSKVKEGQYAEVNFSHASGKLKKINHNGFDYILDYDNYGNVTTVKIGSQTVVTNEYGPNNGNLIKSTYPGMYPVANSYDRNGRLLSQTGTPYRYNFSAFYDSLGNRIREIHQNETTLMNEYEYDFSNQLIGVKRSGTTIEEQKVRIQYDSKNRIDYISNKVGNETIKTKYSYGGADTGKAELINNISINDQLAVTYSHISLGRIGLKALNTTNNFLTFYEYGKENNQTNMLIKSVRNGGNLISYTHDCAGNILTISENNVLKVQYTYDLRDQLIKEINQYLNKTIDYTYDIGGNLISKKEVSNGVSKTINYSYDEVWKDKLINYNGQVITYSPIGNPLTYRDGITMEWEKSNRLLALTKNNVRTVYQYNFDGNRCEKTVGGVLTNFYLDGTKVLTQISGNERFDFFYNETENLFGFKYAGQNYYYIRNAQNDIIGILDSSGTQVVSYLYDSWGKLITVTGSLKDTIGIKNPFRYRGYYYDNESGLYYLQSRYYDPETGRFINADGLLGADRKEPLSYNLFLYCGNNPINRVDPSGKVFGIIGVILLGLLSIVVAGTYIQNRQAKKSNSGGGQKITPRPIPGGFHGGTTPYIPEEPYWPSGNSWRLTSETAVYIADEIIAPPKVTYAVSKGFTASPLAIFGYAYSMANNLSEYGDDPEAMMIANTIDSFAFIGMIIGGSFLVGAGLPAVALAGITIGLGYSISLTADELKEAFCK